MDWMDTPLYDFFSGSRTREDGTAVHEFYPLGDGAAQHILADLLMEVERAYEEFATPEDNERAETRGEVPVIRDGQRGYEELHSLTLRDLPIILDTLVVLEEEYQQREREESERKSAERKERERVRAKERRRLKKLGEW